MAKKKNAETKPVAVQTNEVVTNCDQLLTDFKAVYGIIASHRDHVVQQVNGETVMMVWEVGTNSKPSNCADSIGTNTSSNNCDNRIVTNSNRIVLNGLEQPSAHYELLQDG